MTATAPELEHLLRDEAPQVLGALVRRFGHFDIAEDAVQEALLAAAQQWPNHGIPDYPRGWLIRVGYRRMIDQLRAEQLRQRREYQLASQPTPASREEPVADDSLTLLFLCCHPILTPVSQVALTLRAVGGLTTTEIAHAYGVSEVAMGQRISRAKQQIKSAGGRFVLPSADDRGKRLTAVLQVLYLIFNEGYAATAGEQLHRVDLTTEAIRLTRMLHRLLPDEPDVAGLLALMLLSDARRPARATEAGDLITMEHQQRDGQDPHRRGNGSDHRRHAPAPGRAVPASSRDCRLAQWGTQLRRNRLAADRRPVRVVGAPHTNPACPAQQGGRCSDGIRSPAGADAAGQPRRRPTHPAAGASRPRAPSRTQWRYRAGRRSLSRSGRPYRQPRRAAVPGGASPATRIVRPAAFG